MSDANKEIEKTFANGDHYKGGVLDGKPHGYGVYTRANGMIYKGNHVEGERHGHGEFISADGSKYVGNWEKGQQTGRGIYTFGPKSPFKGDIFEGDFIAGVWNGIGKYVFANGETYEGEYKDGKQHGLGQFVNSNGSAYVGEFEEGVPHGLGAFYLNGKLIPNTAGRYEHGQLIEQHTDVPSRPPKVPTLSSPNYGAMNTLPFMTAIGHHDSRLRTAKSAGNIPISESTQIESMVALKRPSNIDKNANNEKKSSLKSSLKKSKELNESDNFSTASSAELRSAFVEKTQSHHKHKRSSQSEHDDDNEDNEPGALKHRDTDSELQLGMLNALNSSANLGLKREDSEVREQMNFMAELNSLKHSAEDPIVSTKRRHRKNVDGSDSPSPRSSRNRRRSKDSRMKKANSEELLISLVEEKSRLVEIARNNLIKAEKELLNAQIRLKKSEDYDRPISQLSNDNEDKLLTLRAGSFIARLAEENQDEILRSSSGGAEKSSDFRKRIKSLLYSKSNAHELTKDVSQPTVVIDIDQLCSAPLCERIGGGGSGCGIYRSVYQGFSFCVKLYDTMTLTPGDEDMIKKEILIMESLEHDNVVRYIGHDFSQSENIRLYMELYQKTLHSEILKRAPDNNMFLPGELLGHASDIALGLQYLHTLPCPIVHRDLKSENIFMVELKDGSTILKIGDFGEAKQMTDQKEWLQTRNVGTNEFRAPEVYGKDAKGHNEKADVWSYGMVLFELLTLDIPYRAHVNRFEIPKMIEAGVRPMLPELPPSYTNIVKLFIACTDSKIKSRPTAKEIVKKLRKLQQDRKK